MNTAEKIVRGAISRSVKSKAIDHLRMITSPDTRDAVATELEGLADDYVEIQSQRHAEYWGKDDDGADWRVHLHW